MQPTSGCNLNCTYCYVPNRRDYTRMNERTLEAAIVRVLESDLVRDEVEFIWHAGEPLLAGLPFYQRATELIERHNTRSLAVKNCVQTNGVLLDDRWCGFFAEKRFIVGLSLDGPAFLHDGRRVSWTGRGSHREAMRGYKALRRHGVTLGVICVLTRESLRHPQELCAFFLENGVDYLCFNLEEIENANRSSSFVPAVPMAAERSADLVEEYREFMSCFYNLWRPHASRMVVREFRDLAAIFQLTLENPSYHSRPLESVELGIITVHKNGDLSTYSPELAGAVSAEFDNFVVGNVLQAPLSAILRHPTFLKLRERISAGVSNCQSSCDYFNICGGGFVSNKFFENGSFESTQTTTCLLHRQTLASVLLDKLSPAGGSEVAIEPPSRGRERGESD